MPAENDPLEPLLVIPVADVITAPPFTSVSEVPTSRLRFVKRMETYTHASGAVSGGSRVLRILQQQWHIVNWRAHDNAEARHEWRDVPEVEEGDEGC